MKSLRLTIAAMACLAIGGCSLLGNNAVSQDAQIGVQTALTTYADVYQPAVLAYGHLPACPGSLLCHEPAVLAKLKAADAAVTQSILAAQGVLEGKATDTGQLNAAVTAIQQAEVLIASAGALNIPKGQ